MIIAHDVGTSADKASLHELDGRLVATASHPYAVDFGPGGRAEQNPEDWWSAVVATTAELLTRGRVGPGDIDAVGMSGQMMGAVFLGRDLTPVRPALIWADQRSVVQADALAASIGAQEAYRRTGHRLNANYTLPKVMWVRENEPEVWRRTAHVCLAKDFLVQRMTGQLLTDPTDASGTDAFDQARGGWWPEVFAAADLDPRLFPQVVASTTIAGPLRKSAAVELGLHPGTPVVVGGGDGPMASVGVGSLGPEDDAYISLGSSAWLAVASERPLHDPLMRTFTFNHIVPGTFAPMSTMQSAGSSLKWAAGLLRAPTGASSIAELLDGAAQVRASQEGLFFLPYLMGERSPHWSTEARGVFAGLAPHHDARHLIRAVLEGVAFNLRACARAFDAGGTAIPRVSVVGGGASSDLWLQIFADILGIPVSRRSTVSDANSLGCAITALVGIGALDGFDAARAHSSVRATFQPREVAGYSEAAEQFDDAYGALAGWFVRTAHRRDQLATRHHREGEGSP